jgi:hypothetical protein
MLILKNSLVKLLEILLSRKFIVFVVSTFLLIAGLLPAELWLAIALAVLGAVSALDIKNGTKKLDAKENIVQELDIP